MEQAGSNADCQATYSPGGPSPSLSRATGRPEGPQRFDLREHGGVHSFTDRCSSGPTAGGDIVVLRLIFFCACRSILR